MLTTGKRAAWHSTLTPLSRPCSAFGSGRYIATAASRSLLGPLVYEQGHWICDVRGPFQPCVALLLGRASFGVGNWVLVEGVGGSSGGPANSSLSLIASVYLTLLASRMHFQAAVPNQAPPAPVDPFSASPNLDICYIFLGRHRDKQEEIRRLVITSFGQWMRIDASNYLNDQCLKYLGWAMSDRVRPCVTSMYVASYAWDVCRSQNFNLFFLQTSAASI